MRGTGGAVFILVTVLLSAGCEYSESQYDLIADVCDYRRPGGWSKPQSVDEAVKNVVIESDCEDAIDSLFKWEGWEGREQDRRGIVQALQVIAAYPMKYGKTFLGVEDRSEVDVNFVCTLFPQWEKACLKTAWLSKEKNANRNLFDFIAHQIDTFKLVPYREGESPNAFQSDDHPGHSINLVDGQVFSTRKDFIDMDYHSPFIVAKLLAHESYHARGDYHHMGCQYDAGGIVWKATQNEWNAENADACDAHMRGAYGFQLFVMQAFVLGGYGKTQNGQPIMSDFDLDQLAYNTCDTLRRKINKVSPDVSRILKKLYDPELNYIACETIDREWLLDLLQADIEEEAE